MLVGVEQGFARQLAGEVAEVAHGLAAALQVGPSLALAHRGLAQEVDGERLALAPHPAQGPGSAGDRPPGDELARDHRQHGPAEQPVRGGGDKAGAERAQRHGQTLVAHLADEPPQVEAAVPRAVAVRSDVHEPKQRRAGPGTLVEAAEQAAAQRRRRSPPRPGLRLAQRLGQLAGARLQGGNVHPCPRLPAAGPGAAELSAPQRPRRSRRPRALKRR